MNYTSAIFLVNKDVRAVDVSYDRNAEGKGVRPFYTFKTLDPNIQVGDLVNIPTETRYGVTAAQVEAVDVEVDLDSPIQLKWLVGKVDTSTYRDILAREDEAIQMIKSAEARARREELAAKLRADNPELERLSTLTGSTDAALPPPAA